jgi:hypothetical protein
MDEVHHHKAEYIKYTLIALVVILVLLGVALGVGYHALYRARVISFQQAWLSALEHRKTPLGASDVDAIRPWMTFDYINKLFNIPPGYLQTDLMISDPHYPQLTISGYAHNTDVDVNAVMLQTEMALSNYLNNTAK